MKKLIEELCGLRDRGVRSVTVAKDGSISLEFFEPVLPAEPGQISTQTARKERPDRRKILKEARFGLEPAVNDDEIEE